MTAGEQAVRAWVNARQDLVGAGGPLAMGAFDRQQRSPASGAYAVILRDQAPARFIAAEGEGPMASRFTALVYAGTADRAENAAQALLNAWQGLNGLPEPMGSSGVTVYVTDNPAGPAWVPQPPDAGELYCFAVSADFVLAGL